MFRTIATLLAVLSCSKAWAEQVAELKSSNSIRGIYSFLWAANAEKGGVPLSVELPYVDGITLVSAWRDIEPDRELFKWELLDTVIAKAKRYGKIVNLGFFPGARSPDFVLKDAKETFEFSQRSHDGEPKKKSIFSPLPWDETYCREWHRFIETVAKRYGRDPAIGFLQVCGPAPTAMEMTIRLEENDFDRYRRSGYSVERYTDAWKKTIDHFARVWDQKPLAVTLGHVIADQGDGKSYRTAEEVSAYMIQKLGGRAMIKVAFLNGKWWHTQKDSDPAKPIIDLIKILSASSWTGGEMFWKSSDKNESVNGPLSKALQNGVESQMKWFDVYQEDIADYGATKVNSSYADTIKKYHEILTAGRP